ncbi:uncharacterized protein LOC107830281 [Nicotiana tabacum]|uniref:Uncharacterized protein LOC107830281 n=1 Tax=Nicotiana tabacum TaxID=4097 RepID=A0AC58UH62_TOBAC
MAANFHLKARKRLSHTFSKARKLNQKPDWLLQNLWEDLQRQWLTAKFLEKSEKGKKARTSEKGGCLHSGGAISLGTIKRRMEKKLGRPMKQDELFKETHIVKKKKKETDQERWVEGRASTSHGRFTTKVGEFIRSQPPNESGEPIQPSDEDAERMWTEAASFPKWGKVYGLPIKKFHRYKCGMQGIGTSSQAEQLDGESLSAMRETVTKLTSELEAAKEREKLRYAQYIGMQAQYQSMQEQLKSLLASGGFPIPRSRESSPEALLPRARSSRPPSARSSHPPRDRSSRPRQVDPSGYRHGDESSSDGDDNDVQNTH